MDEVEKLLDESRRTTESESRRHSERDRSPDSRSSRSDRRHSSRRDREASPRSTDARSDGGRSRSSRYDDRRSRRRSRSRSGERRRDDRDDRRDDRRRSHRDDRDRRNDRHYSPRRRSRSRSPPKRNRDSPAYDEKPAREPSPKLTEEEHEMRSVFVSQLSARVADRELLQFMEAHCGKVRDAKVIVDRISRRSKGVGYVEFRELASVAKAIDLSGTKLLGIPIMVQYTEAERNRQAQSNIVAAENANIVIPPGSDARPDAPIPYNRLYIGSLNFNLTDADIRQVFQPFGVVEFVDLHRDQMTGKSKGYCFVQFRFHADAVAALEKMNNFPLAGRPIKVGLVTEKMTLMSSGRDTNLDEGAGGSLSGISRIELMQKLARGPERPVSEMPSMPMWKPNIPSAKSKCVVLKNLFNPAEETEPNWHTELREDVRQECSNKYGQVRDIYILKDSPEGALYIKFDTEFTAEKAINGLNNRFFGGRSITAAFCVDVIYDLHKQEI